MEVGPDGPHLARCRNVGFGLAQPQARRGTDLGLQPRRCPVRRGFEHLRKIVDVMPNDSELRHVADVVARLGQCYPQISAAEIDCLVQGIYERFANARIREFIPLLVERAAREEIQEHRVEAVSRTALRPVVIFELPAEGVSETSGATSGRAGS